MPDQFDSDPNADQQVQIDIIVFAMAKDLILEESNTDKTERNVDTSNGNDSNIFNIVLNRHWSNSSHLRSFLCQKQWPILSQIEPTIALALNLQYLDPNESVHLENGDILALIPPISGG